MPFTAKLAGGVSLALAALVLAAAVPANATEMIEVGFSSGGAITTEATSTTGDIAVTKSFSPFTVNIVTGLAVSAEDLLNSTSQDKVAASSAGTIDVYVTETGLTSPLNTDFISSFTTNALPSNLKVTEYTYLDPTNAAYGKVIPLGEAMLKSKETTTQQSYASTGSGPYSITEEYVVTATSGSVHAANSTIDISAVPEPAVWTMMIVGVGGVGANLRARRRPAMTKAC
jgi:hypothetical protein